MRRLNLVGKRFGLLSVIKDAGSTPYRESKWACFCACGNATTVVSSCLLKGFTKSCGCLLHKKGENHPNWSGFGELSGRLWSQIRGNCAKGRNLDLEITIQEAWELFIAQKSRCALSGILLSFKKPDRTASLDRIDNTKGYILGNVQWVHKDINQMKHVFKQDCFIEMCKAVAKHNES